MAVVTAPVLGAQGLGTTEETSGITLRGTGNGFFAFELSANDTLTFVSLETTASKPALVQSGPYSKNWFRIEGEWLGASMGSVEYPLIAGSYFVYVVTTPPSPYLLRMEFAEFAPSIELKDPPSIDGAFVPLETVAGISASGFEVARRQAELPPGDDLITGFAIYVDASEAEAEAYHEEWQWLTPNGILDCDSHTPQSSGGYTRESLFRIFGFEGPLTLKHYRYGGALASVIHADGFWLRRAPGDVPTRHAAPFALPGWDVVWEHPELDYDVTCASDLIGLHEWVS